MDLKRSSSDSLRKNDSLDVTEETQVNKSRDRNTSVVSFNTNDQDNITKSFINDKSDR